MRLVCVSDTHNQTDGLVVPEGDILLHAGDLTGNGQPEELAETARWLASLPHAHKVVIAGNHDFFFQEDSEKARALFDDVPGFHYLEDAQISLDGLTIYGTPWQPWFYDWAFNLPRRGEELARIWSRVPTDMDVLLTHTPAHGILDRTRDGEAAGCEVLRAELSRIRPRLHVFGHIHEGYGDVTLEGTRHVNASTCDAAYKPVHPPIVVEMERKRRS